ncbi:hypothetical protein THAOC_32792, partial [Thalassiosira oceanica]
RDQPWSCARRHCWLVLVDVGPTAGLWAAAMRGLLEPSSKKPPENPVKGTARPVVSGGRTIEP